MAAPKGNEFWKLRSKHGRDTLFASPELMWEAACEYFKWIEENPLYEVDYYGKEALQLSKPHTRPFTLHGLCLYIGCSTSYFREFKRTNTDKEEFLSVITRIEETIYRQKFEGASCGFYNANIIARDLGLIDKQDIEHSGAINLYFDKTDESL